MRTNGTSTTGQLETGETATTGKTGATGESAEAASLRKRSILRTKTATASDAGRAIATIKTAGTGTGRIGSGQAMMQSVVPTQIVRMEIAIGEIAILVAMVIMTGTATAIVVTDLLNTRLGPAMIAGTRHHGKNRLGKIPSEQT